MAIAGEIEVRADGSVVVHDNTTGMMASYSSMDAAIINRFAVKMHGITESMGDVSTAADDLAEEIVDLLAQSRTSYTDAEFAELMAAAEENGRAQGIKLGFQDAIDQVVELLNEVAGDDGCIDPNKERVWTGLGALKPLVKGDLNDD